MSNISNNINTPRTTPPIQNTAQDVSQANSSFSRDNQQGFQFDFIIMMIVIQLIMQWIESMNNGGGNQPEPPQASNTFAIGYNDLEGILNQFGLTQSITDTAYEIVDTNGDHILSAGDQIISVNAFVGESVARTLTQQDIDALNSNPNITSNPPLRIDLDEGQRERALGLIDPNLVNIGTGVGRITDNNHDGVLSAGDQIFFVYPTDGGFVHTLSDNDIKHILS